MLTASENAPVLLYQVGVPFGHSHVRVPALGVTVA